MKKQLKTSSSSGVFKINSLSALKDYLEIKPNLVVLIRYKKAFGPKLLEILKSKNLDIPTTESCNISSYFEADVSIALASQSELESDIKSRSKATLLALDHVQDPRNFGAIVRTAAYYGIPWIIVPKDRQALLSNASVATAQAGFARTRIAGVTNLSRWLSSIKSLGYWTFGMDASGELLDETKHQVDYSVIVLGGEEKGLSASVKKQCDFCVRVGPSQKGLDSLNVSVACGIALDRFKQLSY